MNIVIIEDEELTANDLARILTDLSSDIRIVAILESVKECEEYFQEKNNYDLIFSDIQLGDGTSFDFFKQFKPSVPIIFCTAYDEYALEAFKLNSIEYIVKPFNKARVKEALDKYEGLKSISGNESVEMQKLMGFLTGKSNSGSVLIHQADKIIPVSYSDIALVYIKNELVYIRTREGRNHHINKTVDEMEQQLPAGFYRANRQFIVHRDSVKEVQHQVGRKLLVKLRIDFDDEIVVSKAKAGDFLRWLEN